MSRVIDTLNERQRQKFWMVQRCLKEQYPNRWMSLLELDRCIPQGVPLSTFPEAWLRAMRVECSVSPIWALKEQPADEEELQAEAEEADEEMIPLTEGEELCIQRPHEIFLCCSKVVVRSVPELLEAVNSTRRMSDNGTLGLTGEALALTSEACSVVGNAVAKKLVHCVEKEGSRKSAGKTTGRLVGSVLTDGTGGSGGLGEVDASKLDTTNWLKESPVALTHEVTDPQRNCVFLREGMPATLEVGQTYRIHVTRKPLQQTTLPGSSQSAVGQSHSLRVFEREKRDLVSLLRTNRLLVTLGPGEDSSKYASNLHISPHRVALGALGDDGAPPAGGGAVFTVQATGKYRGYLLSTLSPLAATTTGGGPGQPKASTTVLNVLTNNEKQCRFPLTTTEPMTFTAEKAHRYVLHSIPTHPLEEYRSLVCRTFSSEEQQQQLHLPSTPPMVDSLVDTAMGTFWWQYPSPHLSSSFRQLPIPAAEDLREIQRELFQDVGTHCKPTSGSAVGQSGGAKGRTCGEAVNTGTPGPEVKKKPRGGFKLRNKHMKNFGFDFSQSYVAPIPPGTVTLQLRRRLPQ